MSKEHKTGKTYAEKLRDPRWQKKRLEVMERDGFECKRCRDKSSTLTVHHLCYLKKTEPWDYDKCFMVTLCENCHKHVEQPSVRQASGLLASSPIDPWTLRLVVLAIWTSSREASALDLNNPGWESERQFRAKNVLLNSVLWIQNQAIGGE